ncbi:MAG TPA: DsbA family protein [Solirubrobacteraceae bacterium]|nr:DsbA family protein [Solirubrobacteraceae bacterium]
MLDVTHFNDPGCPWGYSASPALAVLRWRYADGLRWRHVMIGLAEDPTRYEEAGYTGEKMARGYQRFRGRGMPFATQPRERIPATGRACRAVVAVRLDHPDLEVAAFRALQFAWFTTALPMDDDASIAEALGRVQALDPAAVVARLDDEDVEGAYQEDRALARTAEGGPTHFQGKAADTDGAWRFTAPSLTFTAQDGAKLEAGGFQPVEALDVCVANLDRSLQRRPPAQDVSELLAVFPEGLTTREVAACMAAENAIVDDHCAEEALIAAAARGETGRETLGSGALWTAASAAVQRGA